MHITLAFWKSSSFNFMVKFHLWKGKWCPWVLHTCLFLDWDIPETEFRLVLLCQTLCDPMDCNPPGSSVMEFSRQEYWSGLPFSSPGDLPNPGIKPGSSALQADSLPSEPPGKPLCSEKMSLDFQIQAFALSFPPTWYALPPYIFNDLFPLLTQWFLLWPPTYLKL